MPIDRDIRVETMDQEPKEKSLERLASIYTGMISSIGLTGQKIAELSGTRPQYISDIKRRRRPLSREMFMRTLLGLFGSHKWLISGDLKTDTQRIIALYPYISKPESANYPLPVLQRPFLGPKMGTEDWDGSFVCVTSPVKERARVLRDPYILHLPFDDKSGRLKKGDHLLIDQTDSAEGSYVLIKSGWGVKLVRREGGSFLDVETGEQKFAQDSQIIGVALMLLMGDL